MAVVSFINQLFGTFRRIGLPAWALVVAYNSLDQFFSSEIENSLRSPDGITPWTWLYGIFSFAIGLVGPLILTLTVLYGLSRQSGSVKTWSQFWSKNWQLTFIETLRSWGRSMSWGILLILPGLYHFFLYTLVPFVVAFSQAYSSGEKDALKYSTQLVKNHWVRILAIVVFFHLLLPLTLSAYTDEYKTLWLTPLTSLGINLIDTVVWILGIQILYRMITPLLREVSDEFAV